VTGFDSDATDDRDAADPSADGRDRVTRRRLLAACACGGASALAGCPGGSDEGTATTTGPPTERTATSTETAEPTPTPTETETRTETETKSVFERLYERTRESVTLVDARTRTGSGWVVDDAGRIVTNEHVVQSASEVSVRYDRDEWRTAAVLGTDPIGDLAVLEPSDPPDYAAPLPLAADPPAVGEDIAIIGAPFGLPGSLSVGVVSATGRFLDSPTGSSIPGAVQVDATANPGNSGGPILSTAGEVVGVLNSGTGVAVNFGIPVPLVEAVVPELVAGRDYRYATLRISVVEVTPAVARANDLADVTGVLVRRVAPSGPAAGRLRGSSGTATVDGREVPVGGDVVVGLDGRTVTSVAAFAAHLAFETRPGDDVEVTVLRDGDRRTVTVTAAARTSV
jgi:S1-C subfamily serine protease